MKFLNFLFKLKTMKIIGIFGGIAILVAYFSNPNITKDFSNLLPLQDANISAYLKELRNINISGFGLGKPFEKTQELQGKVVKVVDGDTINVLDSNQTQHKIRLFGIDAPEKKQSFGNKAREYLASLIAGKDVVVLVKDKDRYQRSIGIVLLDGKDINKEMVKNGYAWAYLEYSKDYISEQADAKSFKLGLWSEENPLKPSEFRKQNKEK